MTIAMEGAFCVRTAIRILCIVRRVLSDFLETPSDETGCPRIVLPMCWKRIVQLGDRTNDVEMQFEADLTP